METCLFSEISSYVFTLYLDYFIDHFHQLTSRQERRLTESLTTFFFSTQQNLQHSSGDAFHHAAGMSNVGPVRSDDKITRERPLLSREALNDQAQQLIEKINEKRKRDTNVLDDFRKVLQDKVICWLNQCFNHILGLKVQTSFGNTPREEKKFMKKKY